jgi:hypothetical protein
MECTKGQFHQINMVVATLKAAQQRCKDAALKGLILAALHSAETLREIMIETAWPSYDCFWDGGWPRVLRSLK